MLSRKPDFVSSFGSGVPGGLPHCDTPWCTDRTAYLVRYDSIVSNLRLTRTN
jgi:hypothetical protein